MYRVREDLGVREILKGIYRVGKHLGVRGDF